MKIGIIVAMDKELLQLQQVFEGSNVIIMKCGIGKVNAALGAQQMILDSRPDIIISSGCAGGHGDDVNVQDVVVSSELAYHDVNCGTAIDNSTQYGQVQGLPARFKTDPYLLDKALSLQHPTPITHHLTPNTHHPTPNTHHLTPFTLHTGLIVTGDWFVDSKEKMRQIVEKFPDARAVDMESAAIAQTCYIHQVPFISFRVISDVPLRDSHASQYHDFWSRVADQSFHLTRTFVESL